MKRSQHHVVFAITSSGNDFYSAMTRVAVASLRVSNPDLYLMLVCDHESDKAMRLADDPLMGEVDKWLMVETPPGEAGFRNRYIKTRLRSLLQGPFLFLDSDIFVRCDLSDVFEIDCDIAGACNHSRRTFDEQVWAEDRAMLEAMGWKVGKEVYLNGGVLFFNDTIMARCFADEWHQRWLESSDVKYYRDQPALNSALHEIKPKLTILQNSLNAQLRMSPAVSYNAKVWHYYSIKNDSPATLFELRVQRLLSGEGLRKKEVVEMTKNFHPWRRSTVLDDFAASRIIGRNSFDGWEAAWLRRELWQHVRKNVYSLLSQINRVISS